MPCLLAGTRKCSNCHEPGHYVVTCPLILALHQMDTACSNFDGVDVEYLAWLNALPANFSNPPKGSVRVDDSYEQPVHVESEGEDADAEMPPEPAAAPVTSNIRRSGRRR